MKTVADKFDIAERSFRYLIEALERRPEIERAVIFGSRSMGNARVGSDIDLAIYGSAVTNETARQLSMELNEELPLPYYVDVVAYEESDNPALRAHVDREGQELYRRTTRAQ